MFPGKLPKNLKIVTDYPHKIIDIPHLWIPLSDGIRLAARLWRPVGSENKPVPAILEYIPYRKTDGRRADDEQIHPYFAGHGYACLRVDIRGSGDSEGLLFDEYLVQEQDDALEVIEWLTTQPWCNGNVGMMGLSWGGFNSLQVAARAPEPLKAIIAVGATVDRYNDDVHYKNGCLLNEHFGWGTSFTSFQTRPPDPDVVGEAWRDMWLNRLENLPFFTETWFEHPTRDEYWKHGSVCEDYGAIKAATLIVAGLNDLYVNAVPRLLENLDGPVAAITGPWAHQFPHLATPGPAIDFLGEALKWWDFWLKGEGNTSTGEFDSLFSLKRFNDGGLEFLPLPKTTVYLEAHGNPHFPPERQWISEAIWPLTDNLTRNARFYLTSSGSLSPQAEHADLVPLLNIRSPVTLGSSGGELIPHCIGSELPQDQRSDNGQSVSFFSSTVDHPLHIWGEPSLQLQIKCNKPTGNLIVRLCDIAPDGSTSLVTRGMLNLNLYHNLEKAEPLPNQEAVSLNIPLDYTAHVFKKGHRIELALSTHYWPLVWPSPDHPTITIDAAPAWLELPEYYCSQFGKFVVRDQDYAPPVAPPPTPLQTIRPPQNERKVTEDQARGITTLDILDDYGASIIKANDMLNSGIKRERYTIREDDPLSATAELHWTHELGRGEWQVRTETVGNMWCDRDYFYLKTRVEAYEGERLVFEKERQVRRERAKEKKKSWLGRHEGAGR